MLKLSKFTQDHARPGRWSARKCFHSKYLAHTHQIWAASGMAFQIYEGGDGDNDDDDDDNDDDDDDDDDDDNDDDYDDDDEDDDDDDENDDDDY